MLETIQLIQKSEAGAESLDRELIAPNREAARRNISQLEGRQRSVKYIERGAGISADLPRKANSIRYLHWFGSTAIEDPARALRVQAFWQPIFNYAQRRLAIWKPRDFWQEHDEAYEALTRIRS